MFLSWLVVLEFFLLYAFLGGNTREMLGMTAFGLKVAGQKVEGQRSGILSLWKSRLYFVGVSLY